MNRNKIAVYGMLLSMAIVTASSNASAQGKFQRPSDKTTRSSSPALISGRPALVPAPVIEKQQIHPASLTTPVHVQKQLHPAATIAPRPDAMPAPVVQPAPNFVKAPVKDKKAN